MKFQVFLEEWWPNVNDYRWRDEVFTAVCIAESVCIDYLYLFLVAHNVIVFRYLVIPVTSIPYSTSSTIRTFLEVR